jgi:alkane 1-monooxygenase
MSSKALGYLSIFLIPLMMPLAQALGLRLQSPNLTAWLPLFALFVLLPVADYLVGRDTHNPDRAQLAALEAQNYYRGLTLLCVPAYLAALFYSGHYFAHAELSWAGKIGWLISQGVVGGIVAINVAHELIHKSNKLEQAAGGVLLASVSYGGFKIEHVRGHHVHVSTPEDASSARFGENVYGFVSQSVPRNMRAAFRLEALRLGKLGLSAWHWKNELLLWHGLSFMLLLTFITWLGPKGALFFIAQSIGAFVSLEIINYVEHYGLERQKLADGRYERTTHLHSWNSNYLLTNMLLFQLQRHSDHHENPRRRYQALLHYDASPQLPGGYAAMFLLALLPPLWFAVINPRVKAHRANAAVLG